MVLNSLDNLGSYDIFYKVIYVTLIFWQKMGMYSATVIKELYFYLLWVLKSLSLDKSKWIFVDKKCSKVYYVTNVNMCRYIDFSV